MLSLPEMVTKSQFDDAITGIIKPIQKERCTKEEAAKRNVSTKKRFCSSPYSPNTSAKFKKNQRHLPILC
jgi:hypothetical protein